MFNLNNPIPEEWSGYITQMAGALEIVPHVLYDTATYTDNSTTSLTFFTSNRATEDLSNLQGGRGLLPNPNSFLIENLRIFFKTQITVSDNGAAGVFASNYGDVNLLTNTGIMRIQIGQKRYGPFPLWMLPASTFPKGPVSAAGGEAANLVTEYAQVDGPLYGLFPALMIAPMQEFHVELAWPAGAVNLTGNVVTSVLMDGKLARAVQ